MSSRIDSVREIVNNCRPEIQKYEAIYRAIHSNPELSHQETDTAALMAHHLTNLSSDFDIRDKIGGHGLVAILENGPGQIVLLRADMDALPVREMTGLDYASHKQATDIDGQLQDVMHACGHDIHVVSLLVAAEMLLNARQSWTGTIIFLFQPAEEAGDGALGMVNDGLYDVKRHGCPIPDIVLGQHVGPIPAGLVASRAGTVMNSSDAFKVTIFGRGGHGSMPHRCIDPIVVAAHIIVRLQTIVSREVSPDEVAVVTVGSIHAGEKENIIPDQAVLKINVRASLEGTRQKILESVHRVITTECTLANCEKPPRVEPILSLPVTYNEVSDDAHLKPSFVEFFGKRFLAGEKGALASEDSSILATSINRPYYFWFFGGMDEAKWNDLASTGQLEKVPINHSPYFAPAIHPTLQTGGDALVVAALTYLSLKLATGSAGP